MPPRSPRLCTKRLNFSRLNVICFIQCVPLATESGWLADRCSVSQQLGALQTHTTDTFLFVSHTTNVLLFKFRCNILIGVRVIKEKPSSVASGTLCIRNQSVPRCKHFPPRLWKPFS